MSSKRIDRLMTLYIVSPFRKLIKSGKIRIPILMYHSISKDKEETNHPYFWINTSPNTFVQHMKYLKDNDYKVMDLDETLNRSDNNFDTHKYVVITFDDGYHDFYTNAFPILQQFGFSATIFLPTAYIGKSFNSKECLNWEEIKDLSNNGIKFGSHTVNHPQLKNLTKDMKEYEISRSKEIIEDNLDIPINSFCYPYAFPEEDQKFMSFIKDLMQKYNYKYCLTTRIGTSWIEDENFIKRIPVNSDDDLKFFKAKLDGAYDWIHSFQFLSKNMKKIFKMGNPLK